MKALVLSFSPVEFDSRVQRQVESVAEKFDVVFFDSHGLAKLPRGQKFDPTEVWNPLPGFRGGLSPIPRILRGLFLFFGFFNAFFWMPGGIGWRIRKKLRESFVLDFDLVIVNDVDPLPLAFGVARGAPVVADLHEFAPGEEKAVGIHQWARVRYRRWLCRVYLPKCRDITVVSKSVGDMYRRDFDVSPTVLFSVPHFNRLEPSPIREDVIHLVHHGIYKADRGIEALIEGFGPIQDRFVLNLVLSGAPLDKLRNLVSDLGISADRIFFHKFRTPRNLIPFLNQFDLEVIFIPPDVPNYEAALPNKFFEAVQARLGIVSSPLVEIQKIVNEEKIGIVADSFQPEELTRVFSSITREIVAEWKAGSHDVARKFSWDKLAPNYADYVR